jgi:hypothetical protein
MANPAGMEADQSWLAVLTRDAETTPRPLLRLLRMKPSSALLAVLVFSFLPVYVVPVVSSNCLAIYSHRSLRYFDSLRIHSLEDICIRDTRGPAIESDVLVKW